MIWLTSRRRHSRAPDTPDDTPSGRGHAIAALVGALQHDPIWSDLDSDDARRKQAIQWLFYRKLFRDGRFNERRDNDDDN